MSSVVNQKSYLQKYLGGPSKEKKKKKKPTKGKGFKIIDDDIDLSKLRPLEGDELDILDEGEDAPQIAGIVDERPEDLRKLEQFKTGSKWRVINQDDGFNSNLQIEEVQKNVKEIAKENEVIFGKMYSDSEDEKQNDSDMSPPRKKPSKHEDSDVSPPRKRDPLKRKETNDSDASKKQETRRERARKPSRWADPEPDTILPKRNDSRSNRSSCDISPPRKKKNYDSDVSPPRKRKSPEYSGKNRARSGSSDLSPPRKNKLSTSARRKSPERYNKSGVQASKSRRDLHRNMSDRNRRQNSDSDLSPIQHRDRNDTDRSRNIQERDRNMSKDKRKQSLSPKRKGSDSDISPPRKDRDKNMYKDKRTQNSRRQHDSDSDLSPPRKGNRDKNMSDRNTNMSDRNRNMSDRNTNMSDRNRNISDKDRNTSDRDRNMSDRDRNKQRRNSDSPPPTNKKMAKTLEGKMAGLQNARQLRDENEEFRRKEEEVFKRLGDDVSGRNAQAVSRKSKRDTSEDRQKQKEKAERQKELDAKYKMWSKGLKQVEAQQARVQEFIHEASKPVARHRDDKDLEHSLKQVERDGDPMLKYMREKKRERGELPPERPSYKGSFPPNRFNIRPGYRWDGVDRSNGYESKFFQQQSKRKAQEEEAYKWSTEDL